MTCDSDGFRTHSGMIFFNSYRVYTSDLLKLGGHYLLGDCQLIVQTPADQHMV